MVGDPRFSQSRFGPWANGPISDVNEPQFTAQPDPVVQSKPDIQLPLGPNPTWGTSGGLPAGGGGGVIGMPGGAPQWQSDRDFLSSGQPQGPGGFDPTSGVAFLDEGGVVPDMDEDNDGTIGQSSTVDPTSMLTQAMAHGRKLFNVTAEFGGAKDVQGAAEGGLIGDEPDMPQDNDQAGMVGPGPKPTDPRDLMSYIVGEGAVKPEVARALEMASDPEGQMQPYDRMMATIGQMKDPNAAFAYIQGKRRNAAGMIAASNAAMKRGNMAQAAHYATQAFSNIPNSDNVRFAPHANGLVVAQGRGATPQPVQPTMTPPAAEQQGAASGGVIDADETNPSVLFDDKSKQGGYDEGGSVEDDGETAFSRWIKDPEGPESTNIEDRRADNPDEQGADVYEAALEQQRRNMDDVSRDKWSRVKDKFGAKAFDDGGEVEDDSEAIAPQEEDDPVTGTVTQPQTPAVPQQPGGGVMATANEYMTEQSAPPQVLTPEQAAKLVNQGAFDQVADNGWTKYLGNVLGNLIQGEPGKAWDALKGNVDKMVHPPAPAPTPAQPEDNLSPVTQGGKLFNPIVDPNRPDQNPNLADRMYKNPAPTGGDKDPLRYTRQRGLEQVDAQGRNARQMVDAQDPEEARVAKREQMLDKLAMQRHPWVGGDADAREKYKADLRKYLYTEDIQKSRYNLEGRQSLQDKKHADDMAKLNTRETGLNWRNQNSTATRVGIAKLQQQGKTLLQERGEMMRAVMKVMTDNPGISPEDAMQKITPIARMYGFQDPAQLRDIAHGLLHPEIYGQPQGQGAPSPSPSQPSQGRPPIIVREGVRYRLQPNGNYVKATE